MAPGKKTDQAGSQQGAILRFSKRELHNKVQGCFAAGQGSIFQEPLSTPFGFQKEVDEIAEVLQRVYDG